MRKLGRVSHYAKPGFLIVRTNWVPSINDRVVDKELTLIGVVKDVFGPVRAPYVALKPLVKNPGEYVNSILYVDSRRGKHEGRKKARGSGSRRRRPAPKRRG